MFDATLPGILSVVSNVSHSWLHWCQNFDWLLRIYNKKTKTNTEDRLNELSKVDLRERDGIGETDVDVV